MHTHTRIYIHTYVKQMLKKVKKKTDPITSSPAGGSVPRKKGPGGTFPIHSESLCLFIAAYTKASKVVALGAHTFNDQ